MPVLNCVIILRGVALSTSDCWSWFVPEFSEFSEFLLGAIVSCLRFLSTCADGVSTKDDRGQPAGEITLPDTSSLSVVIHTSVLFGMDGRSFMWCPESKFSFCLSLYFSSFLLNLFRYDHCGMSILSVWGTEVRSHLPCSILLSSRQRSCSVAQQRHSYRGFLNSWANSWPFGQPPVALLVFLTTREVLKAIWVCKSHKLRRGILRSVITSEIPCLENTDFRADIQGCRQFCKSNELT